MQLPRHLREVRLVQSFKFISSLAQDSVDACVWVGLWEPSAEVGVALAVRPGAGFSAPVDQSRWRVSYRSVISSIFFLDNAKSPHVPPLGEFMADILFHNIAIILVRHSGSNLALCISSGYPK